jgi:hypothetical protein
MKRLRVTEMKSSKFQAPSSREAAIVNVQSREATLGTVAWWQEEPLLPAMILKDEGSERKAWNFYGAWSLGFGAL